MTMTDFINDALKGSCLRIKYESKAGGEFEIERECLHLDHVGVVLYNENDDPIVLYYHEIISVERIETAPQHHDHK